MTEINAEKPPAAAKGALSASYVNSFRITAVADRLALHVQCLGKSDGVEFFNLCLSLARGIDYAIANSEVPATARELPILLKQVCQHKNDFLLQAAIMVLMISVKNACENRWFTDKDSEDLKILANEIGRAFCSTQDIKFDTSSLPPTISDIMSRFYPQFRMGQVLAFLDVKPGYDAHVIDFHILKNVNFSPDDKIRLFVAQTNNTETSSCIISPRQVNFLLNGRGVDRRTNLFMDTGPQIPTNVTPMLKYGTNLLQAVGQFNGNYIIIIAFMKVDASLVSSPCLDYVQPTFAAFDSDSEIIEGPSRISLNCPIRRIKIPVKGHSCKHLQCFDFDNYVDINSRRPSWRCPHCNQSVCFTDIRIDRQIVKILEEVGENVAGVMISADGSWKAATETNDHIDKQHNKIHNGSSDVVPHQELASIAIAPPEILDLTEGDDPMNDVSTFENEDTKPFSANNQCEFNILNSTVNQDVTNTNVLSQNTLHIEDDFWSGVYLSTFGQEASNGTLDAHCNGDIPGSAPSIHILSPVLTDATSPALNGEPEAFCTTALATSVAQNQLSTLGSTSLQQFGNSNMINEYGTSPSITRYAVNRTSVAVQARPALTSNMQQKSRMALQPSLTPLLLDAPNTAVSNVERQQQPRPTLNSLQGSYMSASLQHHIGNWGPHGHIFNSTGTAQQINALPDPQIHPRAAHIEHPSGYRLSSALATQSQNSHQNQATSQRIPYIRTQSPSLNRSSAHSPQAQPHQGGMQSRAPPTPVAGHQHDRFLAAAHLAMSRTQSSTSIQVQTPRTSSPVPVNVDGLMDSSMVEQDWRPTGRMRGSLSGHAYSAALNQFVSLPTQPVQSAAARPAASSAATSSAFPLPLHVLVANNRNSVSAQASTTENSALLQ